jgi:hypothetical protein
MSITYKDLLPDDISIQDFKSHKEWNIHWQSTSSYGVTQQWAKKHNGYGAYYSASQFFGNNESGQASTGSSTTGPIYDKLLYSSLLQTFYMTSSVSESYVAKSSGGPFDGNGSSHTSQNALEYLSTRDTNRFYDMGATALTMSVFQIPSNIIGEGIKPGSLTISHSAGTAYGVVDDGKGNLIRGTGGGDAQYGNIFYKSGIIVFTTPGTETNLLYGPAWEAANGWRNINFKSTLTMTEHEYYCTIQDGEYNQSTNPTILSGSNNGTAAGAEGTGSYILKSFTTSSAFAPYATCVGLYNDRGELCATGKLARPLRISDQYDISIVVRFDA